MSYQIKKVAVLGSGVMGSQIAAHLANAGIPSVVLDIVPGTLTEEEKAKGLTLDSPQVRNRFAAMGLQNALKARPAAFFIPELADLITVGNFEDDLDRIKDVDWIIEVVVERLDIKQQLMKRVAAHRKPGTIVTSNTSGISIAQIAEGQSEEFKSHFLGTHFFNPPRYMHLLEMIPTKDTDPELIKFMANFAEKELGKGIVYCHDTPNFIANRIGVFGMLITIHQMIKDGLTIEAVDAITGPATGKPKSATFRTADLVGIDTLVHVAENLYEAAPDDEMRDIFKIPDFIKKMVENKWLGDKTKQGFYKKEKSSDGKRIIKALRLDTMDYVPREKVQYGSLEMAKQIDDAAERIKTVARAKDKAGQFFWETISRVLIYAANRIPEITDSIVNVDNAMKWGFNWELGPFETWDVLGLEDSVKRMEAEGKPVPEKVKKMLASGNKSFYKREKGVLYYYDFNAENYKPVQFDKDMIILSLEKEKENRIIKSNADATMYDIGDGVALVEFHTKMNAIGEGILSMVSYAVKEVEKRYEGLVIGNQSKHFSAGANLMLILMLAQDEEWDELDRAVRMFQSVNMQVKYAEKPVVVAPFGMTLGGGCEITLHAPRVQASAETYIGLVEVGVGVIPAGGGTKEMTLRTLRKFEKVKDVDSLPFLQALFQMIGTATVATSAMEAQKLGFLREHDRISMNPDRQIGDAKNTVLAMVRENYRKPVMPEKMLAVGEGPLSAIYLGLDQMREAGYISEYDQYVGRKLAYVMTGGDITAPQEVTEQYFLDLEREAFLSLCGQKKTRDRIAYMLKYGKPLRN
ncbi:putative 3-hydroxyacyl-CoA dehydrogenase [bacterium BMS3Abin05]|nr:putative 3-hydroxyacyl-CoA dehydrogenase [bacterium BMS3Abin05]GBE26290.1 putative 3-hydroxyacyl-CoA dehydrogenase [bacterium BMS3Bbin03]